MKPVDSVPTNSGCRTSPPDYAKWEHRSKLCVGTTPFAWLIKKESARSEQGKPLLVGPASVLPFPPPQKDSHRRFLLAVTGKRRPVGTTVVLRCRSLRERMTERIKGGHVHSLPRLLAHRGLPEFQPAGTPNGPKRGDRERYELTFVQSPPPPAPFFASDIFMRLSTIHKATTSLLLCILLQALTRLCAQAFTASGGGPSHKKPERCRSESHIGVLPSSQRFTRCFELPGRRRRAFLRQGSSLFPTLW